MLKKKLIITNKLGLHARAAAKFVTHAARYTSEITVKHGDQKINAKSIMGVITLAASKGTELELIFNGPDESEACTDLTQLVKERFGETE